jgi:hypothetical protein
LGPALMPRVLWPLLHDRPIVEVALTMTAGGQTLVRQLIADTGASANTQPPWRAAVSDGRPLPVVASNKLPCFLIIL